MGKCYGCKQDVSRIGLTDLVFTWQEFILNDGHELLEVPWHKLCYANELSKYSLDNFDAALARAETAEAPQTPCVWREQDDGAYWQTGCRQANCFEDAGPIENKYQFCPYCGHPIEVAP